MIKSLVILLIALISHSYGRPVNNSVSLSSANNRLSLKLLNHLSNDKNNVFVSPFSISAALGMLYSGAKGKTSEEMREVLGYNFAKLSDKTIEEQFQTILNDIEKVNSNKYELSVANKIVVQKDFQILQTFKENLKNYYKSSIESVDFVNNGKDVTDSINQWVDSQTHHKINQLFDKPLNPLTRMVLLNAVYFKGVFQTKFLKNQTQNQMFFNSEDKQIEALIMRRTGKFNFTEIPEIDSKILEIPYSGNDISLYVVLPNERQGLKKVKKMVNDFSLLHKSIADLREHEVVVTLPKFKVQTSYSLNDKLSEMGMTSVFTDSADLSGIDGQKDLKVSNVLHKAYIEVTEEGTEAAAVTGVVVTNKAMPIRKTFKADHPFMFFIRNNRNGMVLFSGHINQL